MTTEIKQNGILITDIKDSQYIHKLYVGYSINEAKKLFKEEYNKKPKN